MLREGDNVFFCHSSAGMWDYNEAAWRTIKSLGLTPFFHGGLTLDVKDSNLDREVRDDFHKSNVVVVLLLGKKQRREGSSVGDNWAIPELKWVISNGIAGFVYTTDEVTQEEINSLDLPVDVVIVKDLNHFETTLRQDLEQLMTT